MLLLIKIYYTLIHPRLLLHLLAPRKEMGRSQHCPMKLPILGTSMEIKLVLPVVGFLHCSAYHLPNDEMDVFLPTVLLEGWNGEIIIQEMCLNTIKPISLYMLLNTC